ncbi:MAG: tyrosine--tRNA ligase [Planctomycetota bacterium]|jgi:tyrosyl-tRNA synthetase
MPSVFETLEKRGLVAQASSDQLAEKLASERLTLYIGFDPTSDSLHIGSLLPLMCAAHLQRAGHRVILVVGGATGMIGDPSGRSDERALQTPEEIERNVEGIRGQIARFVELEGASGGTPAKIVNNYDWTAPMSFIEWLRDVGKHFTVNYMLAKDSVKSRLGSESGISYTEFSYMTMQAYDFLHLHDAEGCTLQAGGSDQWGNITAGIDLVRKLRGKEVYGLTFPLVTTSSGEKFGKSAGNAVWLSPERTSPYVFYQYWINTDDRDVVKYLNYFTFLSDDEIATLASGVEAEPHKRAAQRALAWEVTKTVHGEEAAERAKRASEMIFGGEIAGLTDAEIEEAFAEVPSVTLAAKDLEAGINIVELLSSSGLCKSKGVARKLVISGGAYLNNRRVTDHAMTVTREHLASEHELVLRSGKKTYRLVRLE